MNAIEFRRREKGLSQADVARRNGLNSSLITQVERLHRRAWPKLRRQLAETLGLPETELFDADGWPRKISMIG